MLQEILEPIASQLDFDEEGRDCFPTDYEDTYDLGVKNGRIQLARELLSKMDA